jgi:hypothetical protein
MRGGDLIDPFSECVVARRAFEPGEEEATKHVRSFARVFAVASKAWTATVGHASRLSARASRPRGYSRARRPRRQPGRVPHDGGAAGMCSSVSVRSRASVSQLLRRRVLRMRGKHQRVAWGCGVGSPTDRGQCPKAPFVSGNKPADVRLAGTPTSRAQTSATSVAHERNPTRAHSARGGH